MPDETMRHGMRFPDLRRLLSPASVAVIGASEQPGNLGGVALRLMQKFGYPGRVYPVNPGRQEVHGLPCFPNVAALPGPVDLALIATGGASIPGLVRDCAAVGIPTGIAWAGGFAEIGETGVRLQAELEQACRDTGFALVGPNCIGIINTAMPAILSFASFLTEIDTLPGGDISMVSQSGGIATSAQATMQRSGMGFRFMISCGNEAVLGLPDYIHALAHEPGTRIIAVYLEGVRNGPRFRASLDAARQAGKPVVILQGGRTEASARAAAAHTGALATPRRVVDTIFRQHGVITVETQQELVDTLGFMSSAGVDRMPRGKGLAVVTFGGGNGVLAADHCARHGLDTPTLGAATRAALAPIVPPIASIANPIDLTPLVFNQEQWFAHFPRVLDLIAQDDGIASVLLAFGPMAQRGAEIAREICAFRTRTDRAVAIAWPLAPRGVPEILRAAGVYDFDEPARAIEALARIARRESAAPKAATATTSPAFDWARHVPNPRAGQVISEHACHKILGDAGIAVAPGRLATSIEEAARIAATLGMPIAMKGISEAVTHRAAAGLVALDLRSAEEVRDAYARMAKIAAEAGIALDGFYLQKMISGPIEILVSAFRDPVFGPMVSCGSGGIFTELLDDLTIAPAPVDSAEALAMIDRLRLTSGLKKLRTPPDRAAMAGFIAQFSRIAAAAPWRRYAIELNPVKWTRTEAVAVDGLIVIEEP